MENEEKTLIGKDPETGRFVKGYRGGPGRAKGSRTTTQIMLEELGTSQGLEILRKVIEQAKAGDVQSQKLILDRVYPVPKSKTYINNNNLINITDIPSFDKAMKDTLTMVGEGDLALEDGIEVANLIEKRGSNLLQIDNKKLREEIERVIEEEKAQGR